MIDNFEKACEQNKELINECFQITLKYEETQKKLDRSLQNNSELEGIIASIKKADGEESSEVLKSLISSKKEIKQKDTQLIEQHNSIESLMDEVTKSREVLKEMTRNYIESNTEISSIKKAMKEEIDKLQEKTAANETLTKSLEMKRVELETKECEINRLREEVARFKKNRSDSEEILALKFEIQQKDDEIQRVSKLQVENNQKWFHEFKRRDLMLNETEERFNYVSCKASKWFSAYIQIQQMTSAGDKWKLVIANQNSLYSLNKQLESMLGNANQRIVHLTHELRQLTPSSRAVTKKSPTENETDCVIKAEMEIRVLKIEQELEEMKKRITDVKSLNI